MDCDLSGWWTATRWSLTKAPSTSAVLDDGRDVLAIGGPGIRVGCSVPVGVARSLRRRPAAEGLTGRTRRTYAHTAAARQVIVQDARPLRRRCTPGPIIDDTDASDFEDRETVAGVTRSARGPGDTRQGHQLTTEATDPPPSAVSNERTPEAAAVAVTTITVEALNGPTVGFPAGADTTHTPAGCFRWRRRWLVTDYAPDSARSGDRQRGGDPLRRLPAVNADYGTIRSEVARPPEGSSSSTNHAAAFRNCGRRRAAHPRYKHRRAGAGLMRWPWTRVREARQRWRLLQRCNRRRSSKRKQPATLTADPSRLDSARRSRVRDCTPCSFAAATVEAAELASRKSVTPVVLAHDRPRPRSAPAESAPYHRSRAGRPSVN